MKGYKLMKDGDVLNIRDASTDHQVGTLSGSGTSWCLELFGKDFELKSKAKALGVVRGVFSVRNDVLDMFQAE